jgi:hypothetical protein
VKITKPRKAKLKSRLKEIKTIEEWEMLFDKVKDSSFLCGSSGWKATFDWLVTNEQNYIKVMEGQYNNVEVVDKKNKFHNFESESGMTEEELEKLLLKNR